MPLRIGRVELGPVFEGVARRFARRARDHGREIEASGGDVVVEADGLRIDQVVGSVVDNAIRYGEGTVTISARREDGVAEIVVADEGPGFPPEFLDRAFERFSRASSGRGDGSGLGLAIVRTVARAHGGEATAANRPTGGAEVRIAIPDHSHQHLSAHS